MKIWPLLFLLACGVQAQPLLEVEVDAREAPRKLIRSSERIAVTPGTRALVFAKWIPGEHSPSGPLNSVVDFRLYAGQQALDWKRDPHNLYRVTFEVPAGVTQVRCEMALADNAGSSQLGVLCFNQLLWYPEGMEAEQISVQSRVQLPPQWSGVSALVRQPAQGVVQLPSVDLMTLIDSPMLMGAQLRSWEVAPGHSLHAAADDRGALNLPAEFQTYLQKLVQETGRIFGSRPYHHYDWLLAMSDGLRENGLEHHQSSDNRVAEETFQEEASRLELADLLAHEFVHSWNGKYRRPKALLSPDYQQSMDGTLLWVYEGLTNFWGEVLPARCALQKPEMFREQLALTAARFDLQGGKNWRSLEDTATSAQLLYDAPGSWADSRRGVDFYPESVMLWLEVDAMLRLHSREKVGIDNFCHRFFASDKTEPALKPYEEDEVYATLGSLVDYDWKGYLQKRVRAHDGKYFAEALELSGWKLVYNERENLRLKQSEEKSNTLHRMFSLGLQLNDQGQVLDVRQDGPAARAGVAPGMKVVAVNRRKFTGKLLDQAIASGHIELLTEVGGFYQDHRLEWKGGPHYPHLVRLPSTPDRLSALLHCEGD